MFKKKTLLFRFELNGRSLYEICSDDVKSDILIGRSGDNTWIIPNEDRSASSHHAKITFHNKAFYLEDLKSRNGIYYQGQRIQEKKIKPGDLFSIGDCKLIVERIVTDESSNRENTFHKFEQLTGKNKGKIYRLTDDNIKIGSSAGCSIVIEDSLISHVHAVIENHTDGTCWVKDMKSRNGTKVNGSLLTEENAETGRMLKDGDVISIAYIDFRFWDKNVTHIRSHLLIKIGIVVATLAIAIGGYFAFQTISPSAKKLRLTAEEHAANGDFDQAQTILQSAVTARGADADAEQRLELARKLKIWKNTLGTWRNIQKLLSGSPGNSALYEANALFSGLISGDRECWQWNTSNASSEMKKAQETQALLSTLLGAEDWLNKSDNDIEYVKKLADNLASVLTVCQKNPQPYQNTLILRASDLINEMRLEIKEYDDTLAAINEYKSGAAAPLVIERLERIKSAAEQRLLTRKKAGKVSSNYIIKWCEKLLFPIYKLQNSQKLLDLNYSNIANLDFTKFADDIALPGSEECIVAANLSLRRAEIEKSNSQLKLLANQLKNFHTYFSNQGLYPEMNSALLKQVFDKKVWAKVLACDCLDLPQPSYSDKQWRSSYDKMLGVYAYWEFLRSIGSDFDTTIFEERFKPDLFQSREVFNHLEVFATFCDPPAYSPFHKYVKYLLDVKQGNNKLVELRNIALNILKQRNGLIAEMYETYQNHPDRRDGIIAGGVALYLTPEKELASRENLPGALNKSLKTLRQELQKLVQRNNDSTEQVIRNEKRILELGIPGDPFLKQPWTDYIKRK